MIFYYRLARELGITVGRLLREVSSRELSGWMAFLALEDEIEKRKKAKESENALKAHIENMSKAAEQKAKRKKKWQLKSGDTK